MVKYYMQARPTFFVGEFLDWSGLDGRLEPVRGVVLVETFGLFFVKMRFES